MSRLILTLGGIGLLAVVVLLALGSLAGSVASSAANISGDASSIAASMALAESARSISDASTAASAAAILANFNVTLALCLGGLMGGLGLVGGALLVYRFRRSQKSVSQLLPNVLSMSRPLPGTWLRQRVETTSAEPMALLVEEEAPLDFEEWGW